MKEQSKFFAAMYLRLSRDDNVKAEHDSSAMVNGVSKAESNSIGSQRELIRSFLNEQEDMTSMWMMVFQAVISTDQNLTE